MLPRETILRSAAGGGVVKIIACQIFIFYLNGFQIFIFYYYYFVEIPTIKRKPGRPIKHQV